MMVEEKKGRKQEADAQVATTPDAGQLKVHWETARMKTSYANVCNVASTREEVTILFGTNQTVQPGQRELSVELSDRIILNPYAAKRLLLVLQNVIDQYETRFGSLRIEDGRPDRGN
jgi:hypothetical protein